MSIDYCGIGKRIRAARKRRTWTQAELAERSGIEPSNISHIERAATKLSFPTLVAIANALEVSLDELVYDSLIKNAQISCNEINELLADCTDEEMQSITQILKTTKEILRKPRKQ